MGTWTPGPGATSGDDEYVGDGTDETIDGLAGNDTLYGGSGDDDLSGGDGDDWLYGEAFDDVLRGGAGNDVLNGGGGADTMIGGLGNDSYVLSSLSQTVVEAFGEGTDHVLFDFVGTFDLADYANVENASSNYGGTLTGTDAVNELQGSYVATTDLYGLGGNDTLLLGSGGGSAYGGAGNDQIYGFDGDDLLIGGEGNDNIYCRLGGTDTILGGVGNDVYWIDSLSYTFTENPNEGTDSIVFLFYIDADLSSFANFENGSLTEGGSLLGTNETNSFSATPSSASVELYGLGGDDIIRGSQHNDLLDGGTGADSMTGFGGDDTFIVDNVGDVVEEYENEGHDLVLSSVSFDLGQGSSWVIHVEDLTLTGAAAINGNGNALNNILTGNAANNVLNGFDGNDILIGGAGADTLMGGAGFDVASYADASTGVAVYYASPSVSTGDAAGDTFSSVEWLIGSAFSDTLSWSDEGNIIDAGAGNDAVFGNGGADWIIGGAGNDTLFGGAGADVLAGGDGIDTIVYNRGTVGVDVNLALNRGLGGEAQGDTFSGIEDIVGSHYNDLLTGNAANNFIFGVDGDDRLWGDAGDDILIGGAGADILTGGAGVDATSYHNSSSGVRIVLFQHIGRYGEAEGDQFGSIENIIGSPFQDEIFGDNANNELYGQEDVDVLEGDAGDDYLDGGAGADKIYGQDGNDTLYGGEGQDRLFGGGGADTFYYRDISESLVGTPDEIVEFTRDHGDKIDLSGIDANTTLGGDQAFSFIGAAAFSSTAGELRYAGNFLEADVNGDGNADFQVQFNVASLQSDDFYL